MELVEVKRHLETKSKYVLHLQNRGLIKQVSPQVLQELKNKLTILYSATEISKHVIYPVLYLKLLHFSKENILGVCFHEASMNSMP